MQKSCIVFLYFIYLQLLIIKKNIKKMKTKTFDLSTGHVLVFIPDGDKYIFLIENDAELTDILHNNVKTRRIKEKNINYAVSGITAKIKELSENKKSVNIKKETKMEKNPVSELNELMQKKYGKSIQTRIVSVEGEDHCPIVEAEVELPNGEKYRASGSNGKKAKVTAARNAHKK